MFCQARHWDVLTDPMFDTVLFDLDGTLTESGPGITRSVAYALQKHGILETEQQKLNRFVGPPLVDSFIVYYGFTREQALRAVLDYREYYAAKGIYEGRIYDGVFPLLEELKKQNICCVLATAKPEYYAVQILHRFGLSPYFDFVSGATMDETRTNKAEVIAWALEHLQIGKAVMVGDREHDILGAKANGLPSVGVLYGYGSSEELENAGADWLATSPADILKYV